MDNQQFQWALIGVEIKTLAALLAAPIFMSNVGLFSNGRNGNAAHGCPRVRLKLSVSGPQRSRGRR